MRSRAPMPALLLALGTATLVSAGCAGGSSRAAATTPRNGSGTLVVYSDCMRAHGVPSFPDPTRREGIPKNKIPIGSPQFLAASRACQHLMPAGGLGPPGAAEPTRNRLAAALSFARCMRRRGLANFPDPTSQGQLTPQMVTAAGIDLRQPGLLRAGLACAPETHGVITRAAVERAVHGG